MSENPFKELFNAIKIDTNDHQNRLKEEREAKLRSEREYISKCIRDANARGLRKIRVEAHERLSPETMYSIREYCTVVTVYSDRNSSTHDTMFVGWDIEW